MKKLVMAIGLGLMAGSVWASCMGPFCWDEKGAYTAGSLTNGNGDVLPSITAASALTIAPDNKGQMVWCSNCTNFNGGKGMICVSTATSVASYIAVSSAAAVTACQ